MVVQAMSFLLPVLTLGPDSVPETRERKPMWCDHSHIERAPQTEQPQRGRCFLCAFTCDPVTHLDRAGTR